MMLFNAPLSNEKADQLIQLLALPQDGQVLDVGCGRGEFLIRLIEATGARGLGIDREQSLISAARASAADRIPAASLEFRGADMQQESFKENTFDGALCIGSTHAFGDGDTAYPNTLSQLSHMVRPGGLILIGEGYWKQPPAAEYLSLIGEPLGIYRDHAANIHFAEARGLTPMYATVSNMDEWDHFEWSHKMEIEREAAEDPVNQALAKKLEWSRIWRNGYLRWGRSTMGFGYYLFRV